MRPKLDMKINPDQFINYYWLKEELFNFCKKNDLPAAGSKEELTKRIHHYLKTGKIILPVKNKSEKKITSNSPISLEAKIPQGYKNDEAHRAFFKSVIGDHFKFNVPFMNWMKGHSGESYEMAVSQWNRIIDEKKNGKKREISSQFEYNQYTRDYFKANPNSSREEAIKCWKLKKSLPGHNKYAEEDLLTLQ